MIFVQYLILIVFFSNIAYAQNYPDQQFIFRIDSIFQNIETNDGLKLSGNGKSIMLQEGKTNGYVILKPQYSQFPFNKDYLHGMALHRMITVHSRFKCDFHITAAGRPG